MKVKKGDTMNGYITTENLLTRLILDSLRASFNNNAAVKLVDESSELPSIRVTVDDEVYSVSVTKCVF